MKESLSAQYELVRGSRHVLFQFVETLSAQHFVEEVEGFGRGGSVRNLMVHVANSSQYWIIAHCFGEVVTPLVYEEYPSLQDCKRLYERVDGYVARLITSFEGKYMEDLTSVNGDRTFAASPFKVFMHAVTHEYHHKGQMVSIARHLGYVPVDTDVIR